MLWDEFAGFLDLQAVFIPDDDGSNPESPELNIRLEA